MNELDALETAITRIRSQRSLPGPRVRRVIRERVGLSQSDIARAAGVTPATVSRWEAGTREPRGRLSEIYAAVLERLEREMRHA